MTLRTPFFLSAVLLASCSGGGEPSFSLESKASAQQGPAAAPLDPQLVAPLDPSLHAPARFAVKLTTSKGDIFIDVTRAWAPHGADRFYDLVRRHVYDQNAFFRVVSGFMAQVGLPGDPRVSAAWRSRMIPDDPVVEHNVRGAVTFATSGPNARVNQFFINLVDNNRLDPMGFAPFGRVRAASLHVVDSLYSGYGEGPPAGRGPAQGRIQTEGNAYLQQAYPQLDYIYTARLEPAARH